MKRIAYAFLALVCGSCAYAARHRSPQPYCATGFLVKPGEYAGVVAITIRGQTRVFPMFASDSVCLIRQPQPFVPTPPTMADSLKPETA